MNRSSTQEVLSTSSTKYFRFCFLAGFESLSGNRGTSSVISKWVQMTGMIKEIIINGQNAVY